MAQERKTLQKALVLKTVKERHDHPSADRIYETIGQDYPSISRSTVYRILNQLADSGAIRRVEVGNGANRFDCRLEEHWHIHCVDCDRVEDVPVQMPEPLVRTVEAMQYQLLTSHFTLEGRCPACRARYSPKS